MQGEHLYFCPPESCLEYSHYVWRMKATATGQSSSSSLQSEPDVWLGAKRQRKRAALPLHCRLQQAHMFTHLQKDLWGASPVLSRVVFRHYLNKSWRVVSVYCCCLTLSKADNFERILKGDKVVCDPVGPKPSFGCLRVDNVPYPVFTYPEIFSIFRPSWLLTEAYSSDKSGDMP